MKKSLQELSREAWYAPTTYNNSPGSDNLKIGCLQRIADSLEKMADPYTHLLDEVKWLKECDVRMRHRIKKLEHQVAAHKGVITKMKKKQAGI